VFEVVEIDFADDAELVGGSAAERCDRNRVAEDVV